MHALVENGLQMVEPADAELARWDELGRDLLQRLVEDDVVSAGIVSELDGHLARYREGGAATPEQTSSRQAE